MDRVRTASAGSARAVSTETEARPPGRRRLLGELLVEEGLVQRSDIERALRAQRTDTPELRLGQILVEQEVLTRAQLDDVLARLILDGTPPRERLGRILIEAGVLTGPQLEAALRYQQRTGLRLGDVLLQLDLVAESAVRAALGVQFGVAVVEPERIQIEPEVVGLVSWRYALRHRVVPLARVDNTLTLLVADPANRSVAGDVEAATGCHVRLVTTSGATFQRAFHQAYGEGIRL